MDIRTPIGLMFLVKGLIMAGYGLATRNSEIYQRSLGLNVNLSWGLALIVFALIMLALAAFQSRLTRAKARSAASRV